MSRRDRCWGLFLKWDLNFPRVHTNPTQRDGVNIMLHGLAPELLPCFIASLQKFYSFVFLFVDLC